MKKQTDNLWADLALGAAAGALATWVMGKATTLMYEREGEKTRRAEEQARGGMTSFERAAKKAANLAGWGLSTDERKTLGSALHWTIGVGAGAAYGVLRRRMRRAAALQGTAFGSGFWLLIDEAMNTALGLTPGPQRFPWQTHARGLAGHLVYGLVTDSTLDAADRLLQRRRRRRRRFSFRRA